MQAKLSFQTPERELNGYYHDVFSVPLLCARSTMSIQLDEQQPTKQPGHSRELPAPPRLSEGQQFTTI